MTHSWPNDSEHRRDERDSNRTVQNHDRGPSRDGDHHHRDHEPRPIPGEHGRSREFSSRSPIRDSHYRPANDNMHASKSESAFNNVHGLLPSKEERKEVAPPEKERPVHNSHPLHPAMSMAPGMSLFERSRMAAAAAAQLGPPMHPLERPPGPVGIHWDHFGRGLEQTLQLQREQGMIRPDLREYERDRIMRSTLQPMGPLMDHERFRDREPHDFTRDNPLGLDPLRRLEQERIQHYMEERDRMLRDEADRARLLGVDPALCLQGRPMGLMPPVSTGLSLFRNSMMYPNNVHRNGSPSTAPQPPPLIPSTSIGLNPAGPRSRTSSPSLALPPSVRNSSPAEPSQKDKHSEKDSHSR